MAHIAIDARIISSSTGRYVERLIHYLGKIDSKNRYSILVRHKDLKFYQPSNPNFKIVEADFADYSLAEQTKFCVLLNQLKPDLVHFTMPQQPILYRGKTITTIHDLTLLKTYNSDKNWLIFKFKQMVGRLVFKKVCSSSQTILTPTNFTKQEVENFSKKAKSKTVVTYEAADPLPKNIKPQKYDLPFSDYILYVGQQSDYKNIKRLGQAHQKLLKKYPKLGLVLVGKINKAAQTNKDFFEKNNYQNIIFTDFIPDQQRDWLYQNSRAYIFPSLMEGFGLPGLEAMLYKTPVVSSDQTCLPEVYQNAAHYFNPFDINDMAQKIDEVLFDSALQKSLIKNSQILLQKYSWQKMAKQTWNEYQKILKS